jgi:hypothetical protein
MGLIHSRGTTIEGNGYFLSEIQIVVKFFSALRKTMIDDLSKMTKTLELVHPRKTLKVPIRTLVMKCKLFADDPMLAGAPYSVRAPVSVEDFCQFVSVLEDKNVEVTNANIGSFSLLCDEFRFTVLSERLSAFWQPPDLKASMEDSEARVRLSGLEGRCCWSTTTLHGCSKHRNQLQRRSRMRLFGYRRSRHNFHTHQLSLFCLRR